LEEKKIPYQYIEVNPYDKPASLLELNPRGLVPTLSCPQPDGSAKPLYESNVVVEYLDEAYPDTRRLLPTDPYTRARNRIWIDFVTSRLLPSFYRFLQCDNLDDVKLEETRREFLGNIKKFTAEMDPKGPFFNGDELGMADLVFAPWAAKFGLYETLKNGGVGIPAEGSGGEDEAVWGRWRAWIGAVKEKKSLKETMSDDKHYLPMAKRYADNLAQSELAKAIRAGKSVP
jgi:glutathione S-transferase